MSGPLLKSSLVSPRFLIYLPAELELLVDILFSGVDFSISLQFGVTGVATTLLAALVAGAAVNVVV